MDKIISILNEIGLPYAYDHFAEGESYKIDDVHIELYTDYKNTELELKVEEVLDRYSIFYNKSEVWIDSEKLYEVLYQFETEGFNNAE